MLWSAKGINDLLDLGDFTFLGLAWHCEKEHPLNSQPLMKSAKLTLLEITMSGDRLWAVKRVDVG